MSFQQEQPTSTLAAMCLQESTSYKCEDYLRCRAQSPTSAATMDIQNTTPDMTHEDIQVCINNRSKMAQWCMTLMDACQLNRETVSIAMSYLDRYLATKHGMECIEDSATFQLAVMTALYSAIKIHEEKAISPEVLSTISRGFYTKKDMEEMEWKMLNALQWRVNTPTPLAFCREYLSQLNLDAGMKDQLLSLAQVQIELTVADYNFVTVKPSSIGFAALVNAMDVMGLNVASANKIIVDTGLVDSTQVFQIQGALYSVVANLTHLRTQTRRPSASSKTASAAPKRRQSHTISPRTVCEQ